MPLRLFPFPEYLHPPLNRVIGDLPLTRNGVRALPAGTFSKTSKPGYSELLIQRKLNGAKSRGICGLLHHTAFLDGEVRPHEKTLLSRLKRQEELVLPDRGALGKPILLTVPSLKDWWTEADKTYEHTTDSLDFIGIDNRYTLRGYRLPGWYYEVDVPLPEALSLAGLGPVCIADGHHRAATHARLGEKGTPGFEFVPVCIIGADELHIGTFARIIIANCSSGDLHADLQPFFKTTVLDSPQAPTGDGEWLLSHQGKHYRLTRRTDDGSTDVEWLNNEVLPAVYNITDTRTDGRITFEPVSDPSNGLIADEFPPEATTMIGFPLPTARFFAEVEAGRVLPPKSTRFEPRVPSGLVVWAP
jgi:uncharacterized protein (DUF1015 family)